MSLAHDLRPRELRGVQDWLLPLAASLNRAAFGAAFFMAMMSFGAVIAALVQVGFGDDPRENAVFVSAALLWLIVLPVAPWVGGRATIWLYERGHPAWALVAAVLPSLLVWPLAVVWVRWLLFT